MTAANDLAIRVALEAAGIEFIAEDSVLASAFVHLERRILRLDRGDSGRGYFVIRFRQEVICDAQALFAGSA
jgi:hypothetical protein